MRKMLIICLVLGLVLIMSGTTYAQQNLASGKQASQSSTWSGAAAGLAVDGNIDSIAYTNTESNPWWQVDLGSSQNIEIITIYNLPGDYENSLSDFFIFISDQPFTSNNPDILASQSGVKSTYVEGPNNYISIYSIDRSGRYVRIQLTSYNPLHLGEVEILGGSGGGVTNPPSTGGSATPAYNIAGVWEETSGGCKGTTWNITQPGNEVTAISGQSTCTAPNGKYAQFSGSQFRWKSSTELEFRNITDPMPTGWANAWLTLQVQPGGNEIVEYYKWDNGQSGSVSWKRKSTTAPPSTGGSATPAYNIAGVWEEINSNVTYTISQSGDVVTAIRADVPDRNTQWNASNIRWTKSNVLAYRYTFTSLPPGWNHGEHTVTFDSSTVGTVKWKDDSGNAGTVNIRKKSTTTPPSTGGSATPAYNIAGVWEETSGGCRGTTWNITQPGNEVTAISGQSTCTAPNGQYAQFSGSQFRWKSSTELEFRNITDPLPSGWSNAWLTLQVQPGGNEIVEYYKWDNGQSGSVTWKKKGQTTLPPATTGANLRATAGDGCVNLEWNAVASAIGYRLFRGTYSGGETSIPITDFSITGTSHSDYNVEMGSNYCYIMRPVFAGGGMGTASNEACATPRSSGGSGSGGGIGSGTIVIVLKIGDSNMTVNGTSQEVDPGRGTAPRIVQGRTLLPIRAVIEAVGGSADWYGNEQKAVITSRKGTIIELWQNNKYTRVNGVEKTTDVAPQNINDRILMPLRFIAENLGFDVQWDDLTYTVTLNYNP